MYNTEKPSMDDLPTSAQLLKSTAIAGASAVALLFTVVLPAEYGIDPTGIGNLIGLKQMGEIKTQLAEEAEADQQSNLLDLFSIAAYAQEAEVWTDEFTFTLTPGQGIEWKLAMEYGAEAEFTWFTDSGRVNFDLHGDGNGNNISYEQGRGTQGETGIITAAFTGYHGWFWRNRDSKDVTVTVQLRGAYTELKQTY